MLRSSSRCLFWSVNAASSVCIHPCIHLLLFHSTVIQVQMPLSLALAVFDDKTNAPNAERSRFNLLCLTCCAFVSTGKCISVISDNTLLSPIIRLEGTSWHSLRLIRTFHLRLSTLTDFCHRFFMFQKSDFAIHSQQVLGFCLLVPLIWCIFSSFMNKTTSHHVSCAIISSDSPDM